jgi:hypothetical protein
MTTEATLLEGKNTCAVLTLPWRQWGTQQVTFTGHSKCTNYAQEFDGKMELFANSIYVYIYTYIYIHIRIDFLRNL